MPPRARKASAKAEAAAAAAKAEAELSGSETDASEDYEPKKKAAAAGAGKRAAAAAKPAPAARKRKAEPSDDSGSDSDSGSDEDDGRKKAKKKAPASTPSPGPKRGGSPKKKKAHVAKAPPGDEPTERVFEDATGYWLDPSLPLIWTTVGADGSLGAKVEPRGKVAAFDLDGTLVFTKGELAGGASYPRFEDDWVLFNASVPGRAREYHDQGYEIAIISNQGGVQKKLAGKMAQMVKARAAAVALEVGVPCSVLMCPARDACPFRKPGAAMMDFFEREVRGPGAPKIDRAGSVYVGDAAGRSGDHAGTGADSDRAFARAAGIGTFLTPEECFGPQGAPKGKVAISPQAMKEGRAAVRAANVGDAEGAGVNGPLLAALSGVSAKIFSLVKAKPEVFPGPDGAGKWRFKALAYQKAAQSIAAGFGETKITLQNLRDVGKLPNVGKSTLDKLKECLETGRIALMDELEGFEAAGPAAVGLVPAHVQRQQQAAAAFM